MNRTLLILCLPMMLLVGCATNTPSQVVEAYFQAIVNDEPERLADLICAAWESEALTTVASFRGTGARLQDMRCETLEPETVYQIVQCQGKIVVTYQGEQRDFPLGRYRVVQENNTWRMCGETE